MSIRATKWAMAVIQMTDLPPTERITLAALAFHHNDATGECFPSMATVSNLAGVSPRRVQTAIAMLVEWGLIEKRRGGTSAGNASNRYTLFGQPRKPSETSNRVPVLTGTKKPVRTGTRIPVSNRNTVANDRGDVLSAEEAQAKAVKSAVSSRGGR